MRSLSLIAIAVASVLSAQTTETKTFRLRSDVTAQDFQEVATAALMISDLVTAKSSDAAQREFTANGTPEQLRTVEWVLDQLDRPAGASPASAPLVLETPQRGNENTIRVFFPSQISSAQDLGEVSTAVRTITDIRRVAIYVSHRAIVVRGTPEQLKLVEWLLAELNRESPQEVYDYPEDQKDNRIRVLRFARARDAQEFNQAQTMIRTLTDTRRVYPYVAKRAIAMRGTEEQLELAKWVLSQVDKDLPLVVTAASSEYATKAGDIVKMFYFGGTMSKQAFVEVTTNVRTVTGIRQAYSLDAARTFAVRGAAAQVVQASTLIPK